MYRKYTLSELDQMRARVELEIAKELRPNGGYGYAHSSDPMQNLIIKQGQQAEAAMVEDRLRTYILAGLGPSDLQRPETPPDPVFPE